MRRPDDDYLSEDERLREIAQILAADVLHLQQRAAIPAPPAHDPASENPQNSASHALEPRSRPSLIH